MTHVAGFCRIPYGNPLHAGMSRCCNFLRRKAIIDYSIAVACEFCCNNRLTINSVSLLGCQLVLVIIVLREMSPSHKLIVTWPQAAIFVVRDIAPVEGESNSGSIARARRQWRPAAIGIGISPTHPGGSPDGIRRPTPPKTTMTKPATIVERRPAPGIV